MPLPHAVTILETTGPKGKIFSLSFISREKGRVSSLSSQVSYELQTGNGGLRLESRNSCFVRIRFSFVLQTPFHQRSRFLVIKVYRKHFPDHFKSKA